MSVNVVSFFRSAPRPRDWNNQELAEFYRVEASMVRSGLSVVTDRGLSDEGDPWFVFCHAETEDIIVHFARIDDLYVVASPAFDNCVRGHQFRPLIESLIESHPLVVVRPKGGGKLFIHPAALLVALVTTCFFKLGNTEAVAAESKNAKLLPSNAVPVVATDARGGGEPVLLNEQATNALLTAIATALTWSQQATFDALGFGGNVASDVILVENAGVGALDAPRLESVSAAPLHALALSSTVVDTSTETDAQHSLIFSATQSSAASLRVNLLQKTANNDLLGDATGIRIHNSHGVEAPVTINPHLSLPAVINSPISAVLVTEVSKAVGSSSAFSTASQELSSLLGASEQSHIVAVLFGDAQKLVAALATTPSIVITPDHAAVFSSSATTTASPSVQASSTASTASSPQPPSATSTATQSPNAASLTATTSTMNAVDQAIIQFTTQHSDFQITKVANEVIVFDPHLTPFNISAAVQELFTFQDGSSIFLIGLPSTTVYSTSM
jgi:hypothetical protein